jgi:hypothetical protein
MPPKKVVNQNSNILIYLFLFVILLSLIALGLYIYMSARSKTQECPPDQVCIPKSAYVQREPDRDLRVLKDPLYPPVNRPERPIHDQVVNATNNRHINVATQPSYDAYQMVGYIVAQEGATDSGGGNWKLMARQKDRHQAEFYMIPANTNYDLKVPITKEIVKSERLRDIYTIPPEVTFDSPLLASVPYKYIELPKNSLV